MACRPYEYLIEGELDNTQRGRVTGWMWFLGMLERVEFDLIGEFHRDIRGTKISLRSNARETVDIGDAVSYMQLFSISQTGKVGDITAGLPPYDYGTTPYIEWYSNQNGRCVLELHRDQIEVDGTPIPFCESDPISREAQERNMAEHLYLMAHELRGNRYVDDQRKQPPEVGPDGNGL